MSVLGKTDKFFYTLFPSAAGKLSLPDFLGIGAQKSGTSWLYRNLSLHPDIYFPTDTFSSKHRHEIHYFDRQYHMPLKYYASKFINGQDKIKGDITPAYSILNRNRIRFINKVMPDLRLIFLMRNPIERAWSHALMDIVKNSRRDYREFSEAAFIRHFKSTGSLKRGDYLAILDNWFSMFSENQIYIGLFDDIRIKPEDLLKSIFAHIGVRVPDKIDKFPYNEKVNKNPSIPIPPACLEVLHGLYEEQIEQLCQRFGKRLALWKS